MALNAIPKIINYNEPFKTTHLRHDHSWKNQKPESYLQLGWLVDTHTISSAHWWFNSTYVAWEVQLQFP